MSALVCVSRCHDEIVVFQAMHVIATCQRRWVVAVVVYANHVVVGHADAAPPMPRAEHAFHFGSKPKKSKHTQQKSFLVGFANMSAQTWSCPICFRSVEELKNSNGDDNDDKVENERRKIIKWIELLSCSHCFCKTCLDSWSLVETARQKGALIRCPLCKQPIEDDKARACFFDDAQSDGIYALKRSDCVAQEQTVEQLDCLDHSFFGGEVFRLIEVVERKQRTLEARQPMRRSRDGRRVWSNAQERRDHDTLQQCLDELCALQVSLADGATRYDAAATLQRLYELEAIVIAPSSIGSAANNHDADRRRYGANDIPSSSSDENDDHDIHQYYDY
jgi:hypothetical protein